MPAVSVILTILAAAFWGASAMRPALPTCQSPAVYPRRSRPEIHRGAWPGSARPRSHSLGTRGLVRHEDPGTEFRQYRRSRLCGRFQEGLAYRLLVRGELRWPGRCDAGRGPGPAGRRNTCPARCDHKGEPAGRGHETSGPSLNDLAPRFAPQRHWTPDGGRSRVRAKEPVRQAMVEIFPPNWN